MLRNQTEAPRQLNERLLRQIMYNQSLKDKDKTRDEYNIVMQWVYLLDLIIIIMKDDSSPFLNLMKEYYSFN